MRYGRLTIWHLLLAIVLVVGALFGALAGVQTVLPEWQTPWLVPLMVLVATDAVLTQWLVARDRQGWSEQVVVRVVEATLLIVAARVASLAAEGERLTTITTWLRDPVAFFGGRWGEYALLAAITWIAATLAAHRVLQLSADPPSLSARGMQIDQAVLLNERGAALWRFDRLWLTLVVIGVTGAVMGLLRTPLTVIFSSWASLGLLLAVLGSALSGVVLHSEGQLEFARFRWQLEQLDIAATVAPRWRRTSALLIAGAAMVALLVGGWVGYVPPLPPLEPVLNLVFAVLALLVWVVIALVSIILLPFAWLLSLLRGDDAPPTPQFTPPPLPQVEQTVGDRPLLPALIFWGCVVLLLLLAVLRYVQQRYAVQTLLSRWRGWRWLVHLWTRTTNDLRGWGVLAWETVQRLRRPRRAVRTRALPVRGSRAQLRTWYRRMVRLGERRGVDHRASQTPYEWSSRLRATVPTIDHEAQGLTDAYVAAEYGPQEPSGGELRQARRWWRRIQQILRRR